MASLHRDIAIDRTADFAWAALRRFDAAAQLFAGVLVDCRCTGSVHEVTFANGARITEQLVTCDDSRRRLVYTVRHEAYAHHSASMQIVPDPVGCRFIWVSDFLPEEHAADGAAHGCGVPGAQETSRVLGPGTLVHSLLGS